MGSQEAAGRSRQDGLHMELDQDADTCHGKGDRMERNMLSNADVAANNESFHTADHTADPSVRLECGRISRQRHSVPKGGLDA